MTHGPIDALVVGASGGMGSAFVRMLRLRGASVQTLSRTDDDFDVTDESSVVRAAERFAATQFERVIVATGALMVDGQRPETSFRRLKTGRVDELPGLDGGSQPTASLRVGGVLDVMDGLSAQDNGCFFDYDGARIEW